MTKIKICGCDYIDSKGNRHNGIYILNRRTSNWVILNKKLEKVTVCKSIISCESTMGNIFIDLKW